MMKSSMIADESITSFTTPATVEEGITSLKKSPMTADESITSLMTSMMASNFLPRGATSMPTTPVVQRRELSRRRSSVSNKMHHGKFKSFA